MAVHKTDFNPNPLQRAFIESRAKADLFSSRMGEGKSTGLCWSALYHTRHNPGASWAIIRDTYENLMGTTFKSFTQWFPPGIYGTWNGTRKTFTWASGIADGEVVFLGMDDQQDASKLMSREFAGFAIDEPAPAVGSAGVDELVFDIAMSRLRQPNMNWYAAKLAENNPDEAHWTYRRFVQPGEEGFNILQPRTPENASNLPASYYAELRKLWAHRPDLIRRFVDGEFGFQQIGKSVTPQWSDKLHLALGLVPLPRQDVYCLWDFGLNPTCIFTQRTPLGSWLVLDAIVGEGIGVSELIEQAVKPLYLERYKRLSCPLKHIGDPQGTQREQSNAQMSAVRVIRTELGGSYIRGPVKIAERINPLQAVLTRTVGGRGLVQVDRDRATAIWHALRGGWHHHISKNGLISGVPVKNIHSHPGDALAYGAAVLFPLGRAQRSNAVAPPPTTGYFANGPSAKQIADRIGKGVPPGVKMPGHGDKLG